MSRLRSHPVASFFLACAVATLAWAALAPIRPASREVLFEIPNGTAARRMAGDKTGDKTGTVPARVRLTLGVRDVLLLRNSDTVPQAFGPLLIQPGQDFRLPFEQAANHDVACAAHPGGQVTVEVVALPDPGLERLGWRFEALVRAVRYF